MKNVYRMIYSHLISIITYSEKISIFISISFTQYNLFITSECTSVITVNPESLFIAGEQLSFEKYLIATEECVFYDRLTVASSFGF